MGKIVQLIQTLLMLMMMRRRLEREDATSVNVYITLEDDVGVDAKNGKSRY